MPFQQSDLDNADASLTDDSEETRYADRLTRNIPMKDRLLARTEIQNELAKQSGTPLTRRIRIITDSGW